MFLLFTARIEERNLSVITPLLEEMGGWPALGSAPGGGFQSDKFSLQKLLYHLMVYYNNPLIGLYVSENTKNTTSRITYASIHYMEISTV